MTHRKGEFEGRRWLVLLLEGIRREDLSAHAAPVLAELVADSCTADLVIEPDRPTPDRFFDALPVVELRDRGLELDRRSFSVRPPWLSDRAVVDAIARRPRGRADALVLWLRDAGRAAMRCGIGSAGHRQAIVDLDSAARRALQLMRRDDRNPHVITLMFDACERTTRTFDPGVALRRALGDRVWRDIIVDVEPSHARVRCRSMHEVALCRQALDREPFTNHGGLADASGLGVPCRPNELIYVPWLGVALGAEPRWAAPRLDGAGALACTPWELDARTTVAEVALEFAARVRTALRPIALPEHAPAHLGELPDLLSLLDPATREALGISESRP